MKSKFIIFFILIIAIILSISCGNEITPPKNYNYNESGKVIVVDADKIYTVRTGSIITNIKPSDMTNIWKDYIGGKKVLKPDGKTDLGWYFEKGTGDYWEDTYKQGKEMRAKCYGAAIGRASDGNIYLMGIYYNYNTSGMPNQWMLIYITEDGTEKGYYGGGKDENKLPDNYTKWYPYDSFFPSGLGKLTNY